MPKAITLGNGSILIGLDKFGQVKDLYFHYPGLENHISEYFVHKIGIFVEEKFSWIDSQSWQVEVKCEKDTMISDVTATNSSLGLELHFTDAVYNEDNIFIREVKVKNQFDRSRKLKIFFNQQFNISQTHRGDTSYYDPTEKVIIHYKGRRVFLINVKNGAKGISDFSVGLLGIEGKDGTYKDAEDGELSGNPIEYGQVDSVFSFDVEMEPNKESKFHYWMCVSKSIKRAKKLNKFVLDRGAVDLIKTTRDYWRAWVKVRNFSFYGLEQEVIDLFNKSLIFMRTHVGKNGAIIASGDSDLLQYGRDTYAYIWPRDAAYSATALEKAGDFNASARFFDFCNKTITDDGYFMHKYLPDLSLGSSWHPWIRNGKGQLPIQEDGTAVVLYALWVHYELSKDLEFIEGLYNDFVKKAAEFLVSYRDEKTGLPKPSYDLWERIYGVSTYTACTVYGAINAAAKFAKLLGKTKSEKKYRSAAKSMKEAILVHLYDEKDGTFYKQISEDNGRVEIDRTVDMSSVYGIYKFGVLPFGDQKLEKAVKKTIERLEVKTSIGGIARFEGDSYHRKRSDIAGNPWIITAMWLAQYYVGLAKNESDMEPVKKWLSWVVKAASPSGILPEQINPDTGEHLSASPLTWSHAEYVITVISYLEKLEELEVCKACNPAD